jgi:hypothetical protein
MAAMEQELLEQFKKLDTTRQKQVLDFVHRLAQPRGESVRDVVQHARELDFPPEDLEQIKRTIEADKGLNDLPRMTPADLVAWLDANPPTEPWGDLRDDEDAAEYVHRMRHSTWSTADDALPGDDQ